VEPRRRQVDPEAGGLLDARVPGILGGMVRGMVRWIPWVAAIAACHAGPSEEEESAAVRRSPFFPTASASTTATATPAPPAAGAPLANGRWATQWVPLAVGNTWTFHDAHGDSEMRVARRETFEALDCFVMEWKAEGAVYLTEWWDSTPEGIKLVGRRQVQQTLTFETPWLLLKSPLAPGDAWVARLVAKTGSPVTGRRLLTVQAAASEETVTTPRWNLSRPSR